ncbi:response regulator [Flaviaesturariibacter aridisoli]|uniref:Response regulator n=1 Tax=Flaviaesturariibacter aridisoli TaxID=2545761 RepID=A0A4R4E1N6_9BACT|nr:response regulator [Flaviaesturariibacter aridisoli]TCZ71815.1 response regulator [Flaviaesturariibacter aridisoli]
MAQWKILLADDDPEDRGILADSFEQLGARGLLDFAVDGEDALRRLETGWAEGHLPCLVVLDLNMPRLNGGQTLAALKRDERFRHLPVVIYSTSINPLEREKCLQLGAHSYRVKPVTYKETLDVAKGFLSFCEGAER